MHRLRIVLIALLLTSCTDSHKLTRMGAPAASLPQGASAYVALPADGRYGKAIYTSSGAQTAREVAAAFAPYLSTISIATVSEDTATAIASARAGGYDYLIYPQILHWEDRATEWSLKPDRVSVKLTVMEAASGRVVDSGVIEGRSGLATIGGDHPQDLLATPLQDYASSVTGPASRAPAASTVATPAAARAAPAPVAPTTPARAGAPRATNPDVPPGFTY